MKRILRFLVLFLFIGFLIFSFFYIRAFDFKRTHQTKIEQLASFGPNTKDGQYRVSANSLEFFARTAGMDNSGQGIILLHGFPESSMMWQPVMNQFADRNFRVIAFDQRGYSPTARPPNIEDYGIDHLVQDVLAVADAVGIDTFHIVGHDWGAAVAWKTAMDFPDRIQTLTALSIPHTGVFFDAVLNNPDQRKRSSYMDKLRLPIIPELFFSLRRESIMNSLKDTWSDKDIEACKNIHREPGATRATLNWYRAMDMSDIDQAEALLQDITRPTLFIWGENDPVIAPEIIPLQKPFIKAPYTELKLTAGHSLIQERPDSVMQAILQHVGS